MLGAAAMDLADVKGRTMLNLDSEERVFSPSPVQAAQPVPSP